MKQLAPRAFGTAHVLPAVHAVARNRMPDCFYMHANLVRASGLWHNLKKRIYISRFQDPIACFCFALAAESGVAPRSPAPSRIFCVAADWKSNFSCAFFWAATDKSKIYFLNVPALEKRFQFLKRSLIPRNNQNARRIFVEAVHNPRTNRTFTHAPNFREFLK